MPKKISRRSFMKKSAAIGMTSMVGASSLSTRVFAESVPDISVVQGKDYYQSTIMAIKQLGGIQKLIPANKKIAILANPQRNNPGAFTSPQVLRAAIDLCLSTKPKEIACISWLPEKNWQNTGLKEVVDQSGIGLKITNRKNEELFTKTPVPRGKVLSEARLMSSFLDYDILIDIPVTKDHAGNKFTGTMKNLMGLNSPKNNRLFHKPDWDTNPESIAHMDQCIADLNTIIQPDLCIVDATEFIITNGPFGPGELYKPQKVVVGTDRVAIDAYCSTLWGLTPREIVMIQKAYEHGIGEIDLKKVNIKELQV